MGMDANYLVCYDIVDNKRRKRFSDALKDLGMVPMQKSVFYGDLKGAEVSALARLASDDLDEAEDKCFWFPCHLEPEVIRQCLGYSGWDYKEPDGHGVI